VKQGDDRLGTQGPRMQVEPLSPQSLLTMDEFVQMVGAARAARGFTPLHRE